MATPVKHTVRKHATDGRDPETGRKIIIYVWGCMNCPARGNHRTKHARDKAADEHIG